MKLQKGGFLGVLLGTLRATLLENIKAGYGTKEGKWVSRAGYGSKMDF